MELLRRVASFGTPVEDLKTIYTLFIRSLVEQSATVWHSSLTQDNITDLERVQKTAVKVILQENYKGYHRGLAQLPRYGNFRKQKRRTLLKFCHKMHLK